MGRGQPGRDLDDQPAQVALVANLRDPKYIHHLVGSIEKLAEASAELDDAKLTERLVPNRESRDTQLHRIARKMLEASGPCHAMEKSPETAERPMPQVRDPIGGEQEIEELLNPELRTQKMMALPKPRDPRLSPKGTKLER